MSEPVAEQPIVAPVDDSVPATTTEQPTETAPAVTAEEAPKAEEPVDTTTAAPTESTAVEAPKSEKRKSKIMDLFNKIKVRNLDVIKNGLWKKLVSKPSTDKHLIFTASFSQC